jgi:hypothetical protein
MPVSMLWLSVGAASVGALRTGTDLSCEILVHLWSLSRRCDDAAFPSDSKCGNNNDSTALDPCQATCGRCFAQYLHGLRVHGKCCARCRLRPWRPQPLPSQPGGGFGAQHSATELDIYCPDSSSGCGCSGFRQGAVCRCGGSQGDTSRKQR